MNKENSTLEIIKRAVCMYENSANRLIMRVFYDQSELILIIFEYCLTPFGNYE
ncbi:hypothetical protein GCM10022297_03170 [Lactobacillus hamsteri]|uniref:Uncharacterized protein n=1 Tax=Lactobacillus hamsteri DSM 5661 = JCM 6256 TaxID=1423754 RepID=A0A0R1YE69_9LACO|nr:hypothetical protein FC39_GL000781 [Lactobacillus hamsteri DSM 5661 = JCM 6256]